MSAYFLLGHPLGHSMSPFIHTRLFECGKQGGATYELRDIVPEKLGETVAQLRQSARGCNVTVPYKQAVIPFLDRLDESAARYGAVNTVAFDEHDAVGYNTDGIGFLFALKSANISLSGKVAVVGCGGAARVFLCEAAAHGCSVTNAVRTASLDKANALKQEILSAASVPYTVTDNLNGEFDLVINATPVGMFPHVDGCPVDFTRVRAKAVFDAVYNPRETVFVKTAKAQGAAVADGMAMLVAQAAAAQTIWNGTTFDEDALTRLVEDTYARMSAHRNIALCGFMGCGKSTVGKLLAQKTGLTFIDTDAYIEQQAGMTVSEIFEREGETGFRTREAAVCKALSEQGGCVLALGGGAVLNPDTVSALQHGGAVVWLDVSADAVKARLKHDTSRPLLQRPDRDAVIERLLEERRPKYHAAATLTVNADQSPDKVVENILAKLGK